MKRIYSALLCTLMPVAAMAQTLNSAYFTEDYTYRHDMNPAFANERAYFSLPSMGNLNAGFIGNLNYKALFKDNPHYGKEGDTNKTTTFLNPYLSTEEALSGFASGDNVLNAHFNLSLLSIGFHAFKGYNTIELNSKTNVGMSLPYDFFRFAANAGNDRYDLRDIEMYAQSYAELALGHSHRINDKLRIGAKAKLLMGLARAEVALNNVSADLTGKDQWVIKAEGQAIVSVNGAKFKTETKEYKSKPGTYQYVNDIDIDEAGLNGMGLAFDLGAVYDITKDLSVSAAVTDLGFINWTDNLLAENAGDTFVFNGFKDVDVSDDGTHDFDAISDEYSDQLADFANLQDKGNMGKRKTSLACTINAGVEYRLPVYRKLSFGLLSSTRLDGKYTWTEGRLSANWTPLSWLDGGVNVAMSTYATSMGYVLNIHPVGFNLFVGMDYLVGTTSKQMIPLESHGTVTMGVNFLVGKKHKK